MSDLDIGVEREFALSSRVAASMDVDAFKRAALEEGLAIIEFLTRHNEGWSYQTVANDVLNAANAELSMIDFAAIIERLGNGQAKVVLGLIAAWLEEAHNA